MVVRIKWIQGPYGLKILLLSGFGLVHDRYALRIPVEPGSTAIYNIKGFYCLYLSPQIEITGLFTSDISRALQRALRWFLILID